MIVEENFKIKCTDKKINEEVLIRMGEKSFLVGAYIEKELSTMKIHRRKGQSEGEKLECLMTLKK